MRFFFVIVRWPCWRARVILLLWLGAVLLLWS